MVTIRNAEPLAHKLSVSDGWYLFAEVCSRNFQKLALDENTNLGYLEI